MAIIGTKGMIHAKCELKEPLKSWKPYYTTEIVKLIWIASARNRQKVIKLKRNNGLTFK